jgi:hypothetical protein
MRIELGLCVRAECCSIPDAAMAWTKTDVGTQHHAQMRGADEILQPQMNHLGNDGACSLLAQKQ